MSRIGDSASVQAVTRVNAEQSLYGAFSVNADFDRAPVIFLVGQQSGPRGACHRARSIAPMDLPNTRLWRDDPTPDGKAPPLIIVRPQPARPPCSACQGAAWKRQSVRAKAERRPTLTGPVRVGLNACVGRGEETGFQVEQRNWNEGEVENV